MVVNDEPALCELVARLLWDEGYEVVKACDGLAGWDLVGRAAESFDLVVTDSRMPGMSGTEFIHRLREHNPTLPIVHISGSHVDTIYDLRCLLPEGAVPVRQDGQQLMIRKG